MAIRDIFVPVIQQLDCGGQLDAAAALAPRLQANVNVVFTRPDSVMAVAAVPDMLAAAGVVIETAEQERTAVAKSLHAQFEAWRTANGLGETIANIDDSHPATAHWFERIGALKETIADIGRVSDLVVIGQLDPYEGITHEAFTAAVFATGRPVLIAPERISGDLLDHIVIAWNGSVEAVRAVAAAMPLLRLARRTSVFSVPPHPQAMRHELGLMPYLARHGVSAAYITAEESHDVGAQLLDAADTADATMIVMGAYAHGRVREALLGGVTHHILKNARIPVLMMH